MIWKDQELKTIGDLMDKGINMCDTPEEAQEFMRQYRSENEYAEQNIGYVSGYYSQEEANRIRDWFAVDHPVFGNSTPTASEAFAAGRRLATNNDEY